MMKDDYISQNEDDSGLSTEKIKQKMQFDKI